MKMKTNRWLIWIVVLLLIMNISAVFTMLYHKKQERRVETPFIAADPELAESMRYSGRWFRDELGLSGEQMREFSQFNPVFRQKLRSINIELNNVKMEMLNEMKAENSDKTRLDMLSDSIGALHSELKKVTYSYYLDFKKILNPEQQEKLDLIFAGMFRGEIPAGGPGRGMQRGRRF